MDYICEFVGGRLHGQMVPKYVAMEMDCKTGMTEDLTEWRNHGACVHRAELDNQPTFDGYLGPMWNGTINVGGATLGVLRYETQEVYDALSD